jgi:DNA-binding NtrC family response regulator
MPARVVLVHDDPNFARDAGAAIQTVGVEVATFTDPMAALTALENAQSVDLLVTRVRFEPGKPHGISLVRVARNRRPGMKALFLSLPEYTKHTEGIGTCLTLPVEMPPLVEAVRRLLTPDELKEGPPPFEECR